MNGKRSAVAFHEAGHAVARVYVDAPPTDTWIADDGHRGESEGIDAPHVRGGQYAAWDSVLIDLAGPLAEARHTHRAQIQIRLSSGHNDYATAEKTIAWLVNHGFAADEGAAWARAHGDVRQFLRERWAAIEAVAAILMRDGRIAAGNLPMLVAQKTPPKRG